MQVEPLNAQRQKTRIEDASALFEDLEGLHNPRRRHSCLSRKTPVAVNGCVKPEFLLALQVFRETGLVSIAPDYRARLQVSGKAGQAPTLCRSPITPHWSWLQAAASDR